MNRFMWSSKELVEQCLQNNPVAQKQLYDCYAPQMLGLCYRYALDFAEAQDMMQEGFIRAFNSLHTWQAKGDLGAWIRRIMINTSLNFIRQRTKINWVDTDSLAALSITTPSPDALDQLQAKDLVALIRKLPVGFQTVFNLYAIEGFRHSEIGALLQISEGTSRSQYARARNLLVAYMMEQTKKEVSYEE